MVNTGSSLGSEAFLSGAEDNIVYLHLLGIAETIHRSGSLRLLAVLVQAGTRYFKLQTLPVEDLVVIESW